MLERAYSQIRQAEQGVSVGHLDPVAAIRRLAEVTFDHHESHPDFMRLVSIENIHRGEYITRSPELVMVNSPVIELIAGILTRGHAEGVFRRRPDAIDVHMMISSFCFFRVANRYTFGALFGRDLTAPELRGRYRAMVGDMIVAYLTSDGG